MNKCRSVGTTRCRVALLLRGGGGVGRGGREEEEGAAMHEEEVLCGVEEKRLLVFICALKEADQSRIPHVALPRRGVVKGLGSRG